MNTPTHKAGPIDGNTMIPDLLRAYPQARRVLDEYGLRGCGGPLGPMESLDFFTRAHEAPLDELLGKLREAVRVEETPHPDPLPEERGLSGCASRAGYFGQGADAPCLSEGDDSPEDELPAYKESLADTVYRPFFKAGIVMVLTVGAAWGTYLLLRIGSLGSFTAVGIHEVNAHGHAQIFGWVGLFVMGFAYQAFPRFKHTSLSHPRLAFATLWMMIGGIVARSGGQAFLHLWPGLAVAGIAGSVLEIAAIGLFVWIIWRTLRSSGKGLAFYDYYILSGMAWFMVQAVYGAVYFGALAYAPTRDSLLSLVATWQAPLRDVQIHGFIMLMILGVSQRIFHNFYGLPAPNRRVSVIALALINLAVIGEATGFVLMRAFGQQWVSVWYSSVLVLAGAVIYLVLGWKLHLPAQDSDRSLKFLRMAYRWLLVSLAMLVLLPAYQFGLLPAFAPGSHAAEIGFSHAYYGAIRHAITVGFISMMIVGVAAKVVPTLKGVDVHRLPGLWAPFVLINTGCAMRVGFQTMTDFTEFAFPVAGVSGLLELTGLGIWAFHILGIMSGRVTVADDEADTVRLQPGQPIAAAHKVGAVLDAYPHLIDTFVAHGAKPLANSVMRNTVARHVRVGEAAGFLGVNLDELLESLNSARKTAAQSKANCSTESDWEWSGLTVGK